MTQRSALIYDTLIKLYTEYPVLFILLIFMKAGLLLAAYYYFYSPDSDKRYK